VHSFWLKTENKMAGRSGDSRKTPADHDLAIWLQSVRDNDRVGTRYVERLIDRTGRVEPNDSVCRKTAEHQQETAGDDLAVRLNRDRSDRLVRTTRGRKRWIGRTVGVHGG